MKNKAALSLALLAFAFNAAQAVHVSQSDAKLAAKAWVGRGGLLGAKLGARVKNIWRLESTNGVPFYSVKMSGGGTLFMASDTEYHPVIAFTSSNDDFSALDPKSPLWALLNRDVSRRRASSGAVARLSFASPAPAAASYAAPQSASAKLWSELIEEGGRVQLSYADPVESEEEIGDLRVGALLKTKWSQSLAGEKACWNYYTPNGSDKSKFIAGDAGNAVCGCVATAMGQVMRYHNYPSSSLPQLTRKCFWSVDGVNNTAMNLTTQGGTYDWEKMTYDPVNDPALAEDNRKSIGKLVSDAGISVYMQYGQEASGAYAFDISGAMKNYWKYGSAMYFCPEDAMDEESSDLVVAARGALYANLDAGLPVFMGIPGHQIVADGYGFNNDAEYVHLNMGWAGQGDVWYNLPNMESAHKDFTAVDDLNYNVIPNGNDRSAVVSGRVLNSEGKVEADTATNSVVKLYVAGTDTLVTQVAVSARGVWGAVVDAGSYDVVACCLTNGTQVSQIGELLNVRVKAPVPMSVTFNRLRTVKTVRYAENIGNSWGNDITLSPSVWVYANGGTNVYASLDRALAAARNMDDPVVDIRSATKLRSSVRIDFDCDIVSSLDDEQDALIERLDGASLTVRDGAALVLSNVVFAASDSTVLEVGAGSTVCVCSGVDFGVGAEAPAVKTADAQGLVVFGMLTYEFSLDCAAAENIIQTFGSLGGLSAEDAAVSAVKIVNFNDATGALRGRAAGDAEPFALEWDELPAVPFDECAAYYVDADGNTNTTAKLDRLLVKFQRDLANGKVADSRLTLRKSGVLSVPLAVEKDVSIAGEEGVELQVEPSASFAVNDGGRLVVEGIRFNGYEGDGLFKVYEGGELVLSNNLAIAGAVGTGVYSGAVSVFGGTATLGPGITIADCGFAVRGGGNGAGVYVGAGATLNFFGGSITGCEASGNGGGVYLDGNAVMNLKGEIDISGNSKFNSPVPNNIYAAYSSSVVKVVGAVGGSAGVQYGMSTANGFNVDGARFAVVDDSGADAEKAAIARDAMTFKNDVNPELTAVISDDRQSLVWTGDEAKAVAVPADLAFVRVTPPGGGSTYYWTLADAFAAVTADGTAVEMLRDDSLNGAASVSNMEVVLSSAAEGAGVAVSGGTISVSGSLAVTNIVLSGEEFFNVNGGMLLIDDVISGEIGCVGGSASNPMLFAMVRRDMDYETLTNSAACFRNAELGAYGVAITNAADTAMVWSTAIAADGSFTDANGVIWGCVGDIPDNVVETEVEPTPIAFKSIVLDATAGEWNLTLTNLVRGCWYKLYSTNSLAGGFAVGGGVSEPVTNFQAEVDGEFIFKVEDSGEAMFWKAVAEPGVLSE